MDFKEKIQLKLEIYEEIRNCFSFNFGALEDNLSHFKLNNLIAKYQIALKEIKENENKN